MIQNEKNIGRDHNTYGFTHVAGRRGRQGGHVHGATDEFGHKAIQDVVNHFDYHATLLHLFGFGTDELAFTRPTGPDDAAGREHGPDREGDSSLALFQNLPEKNSPQRSQRTPRGGTRSTSPGLGKSPFSGVAVLSGSKNRQSDEQSRNGRLLADAWRPESPS